MLNILKTRMNQGYQAIRNIRQAEINGKFRGLPHVQTSSCSSGCTRCADLCPVKAITLNPLSIDLGKCVFCGDCEQLCTENYIQFTNYHKISASERSYLLVRNQVSQKNFRDKAFKTNLELKKMFRGSFKIRQVSAGGCNACELELTACSNVNFDMGRFGFEFVASPRHADAVMVTGPVTENMHEALADTFHSTPEPKVLILAGSCAISGGIFAEAPAVKRDFLNKFQAALYIPGCPVHPLTVVNGLMDFLGR